MGKQLLRSGTSILANYIEAKFGQQQERLYQFFTYSLKSANESKVWLTLLRDTEKGDAQELKWLLGELVQVANILASSILKMKGKK